MDSLCPFDTQKPTCSVCFEDGIHFCAKCRHTRYCSRECQLTDWKKHSGFCARARKYAECAVARIRGNIDIMTAHHDSSVTVKIQESLEEFMNGSLVDEAPHFAYLYTDNQPNLRTITITLDDFSHTIPLIIAPDLAEAAKKYPCPDQGWSVFFMM